MAGWTQEEASRTIDEVKARCLVDPGFRALALSNPVAAIAKINPKPLPAGLSIRFVEGTGATDSFAGTGPDLTIVLPALVDKADELSDDELEQAAGGRSDIQFPFD